MNKKLVLKICCSEWKNASRDERELSVCKELDLNVLVLAKGKANDRGRVDFVDGFEVRRFSTRPLGENFLNVINRIVSIPLWAFYVRQLSPDIISGHDLGGLTIGWLSNLLRRHHKKAILIYDSHEFELGRNVKRSKLKKTIIKYLENFMIKKCAFSIMVNDSIADEVKKIYSLGERPIVVRNIPNKWDVDTVIVNNTRNQIMDKFSDTTIDFLLMYHGAIVRGRGIEEIIEALIDLPHVGFFVLGDSQSENYLKELKLLVEKLNLGGKIVFHNAVSYTELWKYVSAADLGCCNIMPNGSRSYHLALPNKLFENIQSETPVLVSDRPEMRRIVEMYNIGIVCTGEEATDYAEAIRTYMSNDLLQKECRDNIKAAKEELCWEREKDVLKNAYRNLLD